MNPSYTVPQSLRAFFADHPRMALAFSGGVDSAYLLYAARACGCDVAAFYAQSAFQPEFERRDAQRLAEQLDVPLNVDWRRRRCGTIPPTAATTARKPYLPRCWQRQRRRATRPSWTVPMPPTTRVTALA